MRTLVLICLAIATATAVSGQQQTTTSGTNTSPGTSIDPNQTTTSTSTSTGTTTDPNQTLTATGTTSTGTTSTTNTTATAPAPTINGFGDGSQFTTNTNQPGNPPTAIVNSVLNLTTESGGLATSVFYNNRVNIQQFTATFTFTTSNPINPADGFTFGFQNDQRGTTALGGAGGYLGYTGITPSAAFGVNLYGGYPLGVFVLQDGNVPIGSYNQFAALTFNSAIPYTVKLTYANSLLQATITGSDLLLPWIGSFSLDIPYLVGDNLAYVGFTGGTGGAVTAMTISDFTFTAVPEPGTWALMGTGGALLGLMHLRRRKR